MNPLADYTMRTETLDRVKIGVTGRVSPYVLRQLEVDRFVEEFSQDMVLRFRSEVLAKTLNTTYASRSVEFEHPATTWQMFKHRHKGGRWFGWLARRWPVVMKTTTKTAEFKVQERAAFPDTTYQFPKELGRPIYLQTVEALR